MSTLKADTIQNTSGGAATLTKQHAAKMWIQATSASSVSTQGSFNVSSLTDVNAGALFPNATNSFANDDYSVSCVSNDYHVTLTDMQTGGFRYTSHNSSHSATDSSKQCATVHGDLA